MTTTLQDWDFENYHVSADVDTTKFISADSTLIAAGPKTLSDMGNATVYPLGLAENFSINEGRQIQRIFEIGSALSYFIVGRALGSLTLAQVYFNGPALESMLYAAYNIKPKKNNFTEIGSLLDTSNEEIRLNTSPGNVLPGGKGFNSVSLFSDLFRHPFGLLMYHKDSDGNPVGGLYFEQAYISGKQLATTAGAIVLAVGVGIEYTRSRPVEATAISGQGLQG